MKTWFVLVPMVLWSAAALAGPPVVPKPLNAGVQYEPYPNTDISQIVFSTSRQEFRTGHPPYKAVKFQVAEFVLVAEHHRKYLRPDFKAEIQLAPARLRAGVELMADKNFQAKWKSVQLAYQKMLQGFRALKVPAPCKAAFDAYRKILEDEEFLAQSVARRMFAAQDIRARELLRQDLSGRFRARDTEWFDRLCDDFEKDGNLSNFFPRFVDQFIEPGLKNARELAEKAMREAGVDYAVAAAEEEAGEGEKGAGEAGE